MTDQRQPFLQDRVVALTAPTQAWSGADGSMGSGAIDGVFHGDTRFVRGLELVYAGANGGFAPAESIQHSLVSSDSIRFDALLRGVDDDWPDPKVRLERVRTVRDGELREVMTVRSHLDGEVEVRLRAVLTPDFAPLQDVKAGIPGTASWAVAEQSESHVELRADAASLRVSAPGASISVGAEIRIEWALRIGPRASADASFTLTMNDPALVVRGVSSAPSWVEPVLAPATDARAQRWLRQSLRDLAALRLRLPDDPDVFFAAGAPWFFTLFGRDSLWAARLLLPLDRSVAASTLRVLARLQGGAFDTATAEQPGKIMHELRAGTLSMPGEGIVLPPLYYGTVDATPLWICLLVDAAAAGMPEREVTALIPHLEAAVAWMRESAGESGFLDYVDETGHGLSNQGWKDSGDSIQWRDGSLAQGPIALCEVQGYAYEAAVGAADILDRFGRPGGDDLRTWAAALKDRFKDHFWVTTPEGRYPAIALDRDGQPVDSLTSNIGHLLGTGILEREDEVAVSALLTGPSMSSGFGVRTLSTAAGGYWPLSYHGGSVWTHDTAIIARGMARAGLIDDARLIADGMLAAADAFAYRVPELHSGDDAAKMSAPAPYPAACRPQAWSAAAAVTAWEIARG